MGLVIKLYDKPRKPDPGPDPFDTIIPVPQRQEPTPKPVAVPDSLPESLEDQLMTYYTVKLEAIASQYQDGCREWTRKHRTELHTDICRASDNIDEIWKSTLAGGTTVGMFEAAVTGWHSLELEAIRLYSQHTELEKEMAAKCRTEQIKSSIPACYACHESRWWVDHSGNRKCAICHPPSTEKIVKEWL